MGRNTNWIPTEYFCNWKNCDHWLVHEWPRTGQGSYSVSIRKKMLTWNLVRATAPGARGRNAEKKTKKKAKLTNKKRHKAKLTLFSAVRWHLETSPQLARRCNRTRRHCLMLAVTGRPHSARSSKRASAAPWRSRAASCSVATPLFRCSSTVFKPVMRTVSCFLTGLPRLFSSNCWEHFYCHNHFVLEHWNVTASLLNGR